jgi:hypothetical protein
MTTTKCRVKAGGTSAISGSRPSTHHAARFYRESAASLRSALAGMSSTLLP